MHFLLSQQSPIPLHAIIAIFAIVVGGVQLVLKKGTPLHKFMGWVWVSLMLIVCFTSFFIHKVNLWGKYSPIHLLSIWTIIAVFLGIYFARIGNIKRHKIFMVWTYWLALILTGFFTFYPGRVMNLIFFG
ncbi:putative membrane protein (DUF2306) [alpha proteobacterium HIMB59]|nr:putative membrane protein (DUF2306) [alpha proteobacterium HIMB59]